MGERITEVKRRLDGSEARFECELLARSASRVVVVYRFDDPVRGVIDSYGLFWARRSYLCYHMVPRNSAFAVRSRFDVIRGMRFTESEAAYIDLLLDLWVEDGVLRWEDEDEVEALDAVGGLAGTDRARIERTRGILTGGYVRIVDEVRSALRASGVPRV